MLDSIIKGGLSGIAYGLLLGPLFFISLRITLLHGIRHGFALVFGAFFSDATLVMGAWWGASELSALAKANRFQTTLGVVSASMILLFGIIALIPRKKTGELLNSKSAETTVRKHRYTIGQGFLFNLANPSNWLFWLSLGTAAHADATAAGDIQGAFMFMLTALVVVFSTDVIKVLLAHQIGQRLTEQLLRRVITLSGIILIAVGAWMLLNILKNAS